MASYNRPIKYLVNKFFNGNGRRYQTGYWSISSGGYDLIAEICYISGGRVPTPVCGIFNGAYGYTVELYMRDIDGIDLYGLDKFVVDCLMNNGIDATVDVSHIDDRSANSWKEVDNQYKHRNDVRISKVESIRKSTKSNKKKGCSTMVRRLSESKDYINEIRYGEWKHSLPTNPTQYERLMNYVESIIHVCDLAREEADVVLMHLEEAEDFFSDERNYRYYDFDKKMNEIAKIMEQLEQVRRRIRKLEK